MSNTIAIVISILSLCMSFCSLLFKVKSRHDDKMPEIMAVGIKTCLDDLQIYCGTRVISEYDAKIVKPLTDTITCIVLDTTKTRNNTKIERKELGNNIIPYLFLNFCTDTTPPETIVFAHDIFSLYIKFSNVPQGELKMKKAYSLDREGRNLCQNMRFSELCFHIDGSELDVPLAYATQRQESMHMHEICRHKKQWVEDKQKGESTSQIDFNIQSEIAGDFMLFEETAYLLEVSRLDNNKPYFITLFIKLPGNSLQFPIFKHGEDFFNECANKASTKSGIPLNQLVQTAVVNAK